jgi:hypothetical protein
VLTLTCFGIFFFSFPLLPFVLFELFGWTESYDYGSWQGRASVSLIFTFCYLFLFLGIYGWVANVVNYASSSDSGLMHEPDFLGPFGMLLAISTLVIPFLLPVMAPFDGGKMFKENAQFWHWISGSVNPGTFFTFIIRCCTIAVLFGSAPVYAHMWLSGASTYWHTVPHEFNRRSWGNYFKCVWGAVNVTEFSSVVDPWVLGLPGAPVEFPNATSSFL